MRDSRVSDPTEERVEARNSHLQRHATKQSSRAMLLLMRAHSLILHRTISDRKGVNNPVKGNGSDRPGDEFHGTESSRGMSGPVRSHGA